MSDESLMGEPGDDPIEQEAAALYDIAEMEKEVADEFAALNRAIRERTDGKPGVYGCVSTGTEGVDGGVAVRIDDLAGVSENHSPGWISLHGRVRVQGLRFHRDETGMLIVWGGRGAPPVST